MDKPFIVFISGQAVCHCKTLDQARQSLKDSLTARKKIVSGVIYQAVETIEPVNFVTEWKIGQINLIEPEPGYQPEGFAASVADHGHAGFGGFASSRDPQF